MRPTKDEWALKLAALVATRATCLRRSVGCVLTDGVGRVLATGYNGVATGLPHCNEEGPLRRRLHNDGDEVIIPAFPHACAGATAPSGTQLDFCEAVHAEQNALLQCRDVREIATCYVTVTPCVTCTKLLLNTGCRRVVASQAYSVEAPSKELWTKSGRVWTVVG